MNHLEIQPGKMTLAQARRVFEAPLQVSLPTSADADIAAGVDCVNRVVEEDRTVYGVNTGFGLLAQTRIEKDQLEDLQRSLVLSHATGVGGAMKMPGTPDHGAQGQQPGSRLLRHSPRGAGCLVALINAEVYPQIPLKLGGCLW